MNSKKNLKRNLLICLLAGSAVMYTLPLHAATSVIGNNQLPTGGQSLTGNHEITPDIPVGGTMPNNPVMTIKQDGANGIIKWGTFDVGGSATVNFEGNVNGYNTLNYVNGANVSQIYGTINANNNGNIFIVNPAGVQIGNSAQINVGSLYVSNQNLDTVDWSSISANTDVNTFLNQYDTHTNAELMSLGNINITNVKNGNVTFEGNGRIVIDTERIKKNDVVTDNFIVKTDDKNDVLLGYDAYNTENNPGTYDGMQKTFANNVFVNNSATATAVDGYMWVEDVEQLQAINTNLSGNYALRNSIDATSTEQNGFTSIGSDDSKAFTGNFDGIDYNIFGLTIKNDGENTGLFGYTNNATISNVTLVGGSITGKDNVGAIVGNANNTTLTNVVNSAAVSGDSNVGGIVGIATDTTVEDAINTGAIEGIANTDNGGINVGGLIGSMNSSHLIGNSYNLGDVTSIGSNVGGLVGSALNSTIGDGTNLVYNRLDVTGAYNVGGIVGNMEGSTVKNAENSGTVLATEYDDGTYKYHAGTDNTTDSVIKNVNVANVGGIVGISSNSTITNVENSGDVSTETIGDSGDNSHIYRAGNVGGVVGSAVNTNITNATNKENSVRGAHNVGGIAGYFSGEGTINKGINDGGDIMATGARYGGQFITEMVRANGQGNENFIIGNIGGVVGYMDGDDVYVTGSANRGTVHTYNEFTGTVPEYAKAANVGGIVGKIDRKSKNTLEGIKDNPEKAAVKDSYNTGDILGYTGVGGVIGMMYNGAVTASYNLGTVNTTRQIDASGGNDIDPLNMGGVVGDTTEQTEASAVIYDVYNKGQIGDDDFVYFARHVGGVVGRLNGDIDKAYNNGDIYNKDTAVGGIVGWWYGGNISNVFNTGNITVRTDTELQVGGIVGAAEMGDKTLKNSYNLGTIRGFQEHGTELIYLGGNIGRARGGQQLSIDNVYTLGNLYAGRSNQTDGYTKVEVGAIYGGNDTADVSNAYYITSESTEFSTAQLGVGGVKSVDFGERYDGGSYGSFDFSTQTGGTFNNDGVWRIYKGSTTPILNAFLPNTEKYFYNKDLSDEGITSIQYGTAYDPLLTIINANGDLSYDWNELGISGAASIAVYGGGLTLDNVDTSGGTGYYAGLLYSDGDLILNADIDDAQNDGHTINGDIGLGSAAKLYGSSVNINADGKVTIYGSVTSTAGKENTTGDINITASDVDIYGTLTSAKEGSTIDIIGISNKASQIKFNNIDNPESIMPHISNRFTHSVGSKNTGDITITANGTPTDINDDGKIEDGEITGGNVNLYYGNKEHGLITTGGNLTVTGTGDVYVDSDLDIGGDLKLNGTGADSEVVLDVTNIGQVRGEEYISRLEDAVRGIELTSSNRENIINAILEAGITNDQQEAGRLAARLINSSFEDFGDEKSLEYFHEFMHHFSKVGFGDGTQAGNATITLNAAKSGNTKLTIDMWNDVTETYDLTKYDEKNTASSNNHTLLNELNNLNIVASTLDTDGGVENTDKAQKVTYIWVSSGEQLKGIQDYYDAHKNDEGGTGILSYNFALKGDINASDVEDYVAIGTGNKDASSNEIGFTGTFDGRGNRIIGLNVSGDDAGIFSTVGTNTVNNNDGTTTTYTGTVKDVNIYSGTFTGKTTAGAVAGENNGRIEGIVTFGNTVTVTGKDGKAGGIVGVNNSGEFKDDANDGELTNGIYDVESTGSVIAGSSSAIAGGLVATNNGGIANSFSDSAVTVDTNVTSGTSAGLGGVVGINNGNVQYVDSLGVTNGGATGSSNIGGIIGTNNGNMYSGYNESIVSGNDKVGGIIGENKSGKTVSNVVNATSVTGATKGNDISEYVGGLVGVNSGSVTNGRNNGTITGVKYVGGMVGSNKQGATLKNLVNDSSAAITGEQYVGGIAGDNAGTITTGNEETDETVNLINRGKITGQKYVGGVAGSNSGIITNANNDVELNVKDSTADAEFFGGIAGENTKGGIIKNATNTADVNADGATYVGGIVGKNDGTLENMAGNSGNVTGKDFVGGVAGQNNTALDGVIASNDGTVKATEGGAGGIFAENKGNITNSTLTNNMVVAGGKSGSTGGIIGVNSGHITYSSLKNEADAQVIGMNNVGGLIGKNTGDITGGRDAADSYYKYQIYNNGVINVGTWKDDNNNGIVEDDEVKLAGTGSNIGGLFGTNSGKVTAGYNTGAINASGSTNVGGIAGSNAGTIDQVFNTVMTENGQNQTITGGTNVGGLVGDNTGTITNAYNTSNVVATNQDGIVGNLVGTNTGEVKFVYGVANNLIGSGTDAVNGYVIDTSDQWKQEGSYAGFTFGANGWKIYNGYSNPMLSVFLTKVTVVDQHLVNQYFSAKHYGELHQITADDIKALIAIGAISAPDGFGAFNNNNGLIQGVADDAMANSGNWLYSQQILGSNINGLFNPNNLGYDISLVYSPFELDNDPSSHWNYLFNDAPFDRNKDFRERKAEVNFVDGGMEI